MKKEILYKSRIADTIWPAPGESLPEDRTSWNNETTAIQDDIVSEWTLKAKAVITELASDFSGQYKDLVSKQLSISLEKYKQMVYRETDQLISYANNNFEYYRNEDNFSLRHKSEETTAMALAEDLVNQTRDELDATTQAMKEGIDSWEETLVDEASFSIEQWEESFKQEFQMGLDKWDRAEQSLLAERIDWELRIEEKYAEAENSWNTAFDIFARNRKEWVREISLDRIKLTIFKNRLILLNLKLKP